ncbi:MAG TPA: hypothetical protein VGY54_20650, partial [Polyangiaceae bacterium]|nr:hypothetical protein [Polyangiaceae bacterium]
MKPPFLERPIASGGDAYGTHRVVLPPGAMPQPAWRLDNDFTRLFAGEVLLAVEALNIDAASFTQIEGEARTACGGDDESDAVDRGIAHIFLRTVADRG